MARKTYTREFKLQAVRLITHDGLSVAEAARRLGVKQETLRVWREAAAGLGDAAFPGPGNLSPEQDELRRLRAEVAGPHAFVGVVALLDAGALTNPFVRGQSSTGLPRLHQKPGFPSPKERRKTPARPALPGLKVQPLDAED